MTINAHTIGSKCEATQDLDISGIAKLVRKDIKAAIKSGSLPTGLKVSVKIARYSMGQSITATVKACPVVIYTPAALNHTAVFASEVYTAAGVAIRDALQSILAAYNYSNSDPRADYYHNRFAGMVRWDHAIRTTAEAAATPAPVVAPAPVALVAAPAPARKAAPWFAAKFQHLTIPGR